MVDIGLSGVAIVTAAPAPVGAHVDLEIQPKDNQPGSDAIFVRGTVVRVDAAGDRDCLMAVHLRVAPPDARAYEPAAFDIQELIAATRTNLLARPTAPVAIDEYFRQERLASVEQETPRTRRKWRYLLLALFLLLLLALPVGLWWHWHRTHGLIGTIPTDRTDKDVPAPAPGMTVPTPAIQVSEMIARAVPAQPHERNGHDLSSPSITPLDSVPDAEVSVPANLAHLDASLARGQGLLQVGDWKGACDALKPFTIGDTASPVERVQAALGMAQAAWVQGKRDEARAALSVVKAAAVNVDPVWQQSVASMAEVFAQGAQAVGNHVLFDVAELAAAETPPATTTAGLHLVIDKSEFVLHVMDGSEEIRRFPIGLGFAGATPEGQFVVANMLQDPAWFNRGDPIPPGDPRNPLGSRWMGLGRDGVATPFGIHGTIEPDSIGREASRGCIRMRPHDAESLFSLCSVGTSVTIVP